MTPSRRASLAALLLAALTVVLYWPVRGHGFVNFDDPDYVTHNPQVSKGLTLEGVVWAFTHAHAQNWHPLTWLSHMADVEWFGMNPGAHHLVNVLFHAANGALLCLVLWRMTGALGRSGAVAALFAFHPLHVESVAWIAERKDVLSTFFWLLTLGAYARYVRSRRRGDYTLTLGLFALGLMSKPMVVTLPFVLLLLDVWPLRRLPLTPSLSASEGEKVHEGLVNGKLRQLIPALVPLVREKIPFFALTGLACAITYFVQQRGGAVATLEEISFGLRAENAVLSYVRYLGKMCWPVDLSIYYPFRDTWTLWHVAGAALLLVAVTVFVTRRLVKRPYLAVGWLWYLGTLVPVNGLIQVGGQAMADRYTYVPLTGVFIMLVWSAADLAAGARARTLMMKVGTVAVVVACLIATRGQLVYWSSNSRLFEEALRIAPSELVRVNLGNALLDQGRVAEAMKEYQAAIKWNPKFAAAHYNLGQAWAKQGRWTNAVAAYTEAVRIQPRFPDALNNLGVALAALGKFDAARARYEEALRLRPGDAGVLNNLGNVLAELGRLEEAIACYAEAIRHRSDYAEAQLNWGIALADLGKMPQAVVHYQESLRLDPANPKTHNELARALAEQGQFAPALEHYATALRLKPDFAEAHVNLGLALTMAGKLAEAKAAFTQALQLKPDSANAHNNLGFLSAKEGLVREAIQHYSEAVRLRPDLAPALNSLAWIYATHPDAQLRNTTEAVKLAERACSLTRRQQPVFLDTLAAAYAEAGRFSEAISTAREALELAARTGQQELEKPLESRLQSYQNGKPWRQAGP